MKTKNLSLNRLWWTLLILGSMIINVSCNDAFKDEIDQLKSDKADLQAQIDATGSSIAELEAQKAELETQKASLQSDTTALNELIAQLEQMIVNKYVERYLMTIVGTENFTTDHWQHLYNEDGLLSVSKFVQSENDDFDISEILDGEKGSSVTTEFLHTYEDGVLISTISSDQEIFWTIESGKITELRLTLQGMIFEYGIFSVDPASGNITRGDYYNEVDEIGYTYLFTYDENNLLTKSEGTSDGQVYEEEIFVYDDNYNLIKYQEISNGITYIDKAWTYNQNGRITRYVSDDYNENDSLNITYGTDNSKEIYYERTYDWDPNGQSKSISKRRYDADGNQTYYFSQFGNNTPEHKEIEYTNGKLTKETQYTYRKNANNENYIYSSQSTTYVRDTEGTVTSEEWESNYYFETGEIEQGSLVKYNNITWNSFGTKLSYEEEEYDFTNQVLIRKVVHVGVEYDETYVYELSTTSYYVENGVALYISESSEYTESFATSPFAPKTRVWKIFDATGETASYTFVNDVNSAIENNQNWLLVP